MKAKRNQRSGEPSARQNKKKTPAAAPEAAVSDEKEAARPVAEEAVVNPAAEAAPAAAEEARPAVEENAPAAQETAAPAAEERTPVKEAGAPTAREDDAVFERRLARRQDELKWLYCELYHGDLAAYDYFVSMLRRSWADRKAELRAQDGRREADPDWYRRRDLLGMMLYTNAFAGTLEGVREKLPYIQECGVNYLHLMPLLESPKGRSDGGYAVSDFRKVQPELGTMADLERLADDCREKDISLCLDFVMNHTSEDHEWARKARAGEPGYRERYFFYDNWDIPREFEKTVPQVFPTTAPGSFTWLPDCQKVVMTNFYPYQWDLNYANPMVFNDMTENLLYLANRGIDVIRLDAVPYIWKELGTNCRNLPQVHTLVRMMRMVCEIVCPSVLLLGEVVMEPAKVAPYFGTPDKPECHMLYNVTTMATTWHTLATGDVSLLRHQMDAVCALPRDFLFLNYLRCHDDIGWGLDYPWLKAHFGTDEVAHKKYLNDWFTGKWPGSDSRGELYNDDPRLGDARLCGTTASLCGVEAADYEQNPFKLERAIACDLMLHAWMLTQSGIPVLYSGDEVGQLNDYSYHQDPEKWDDSRYLHRGAFQWDLAALRRDGTTRQGKQFMGLRRLEELRCAEPAFDARADVWTFDTGSAHVLGVGRWYKGRKLIAMFNFSPEFVTVSSGEGGAFDELVYGGHFDDLSHVELYPYGFVWLAHTEG
ncbi:alpha-amylase family protein [uncultured Pseudoflavonifractor sp.]|uniref:alpha-amylase family protein n=1 Tax=uncultured Pseudoflavonifractor sp. TaxID=1221379 RepID=UPI0025D7E944|nr:alpha-amylase family protein [uncultured Pseudoflavonifractor sp.]